MIPDFTLFLILPDQSEQNLSSRVRGLEIHDHWELHETHRGAAWTRELACNVRCTGEIPFQSHNYDTRLRLTLPDSPPIWLMVVDSTVDLTIDLHTRATTERGYTLRAKGIPTP